MFQYIKNFEPLWDVWKAGEKIGEGSYGSVWEVHKLGDNECCAAVKEIAIPASEKILEDSKLEGLDLESAKLYFRGVLKKIMQEVFLMQKLSRCPYIVQFNDFQICELEKMGRFGWVLFIRMELLEPIRNRLLNKTFSLGEIGKLGINLCRALEFCEEKGIIHQDIKPDNIFYDVTTDRYKLGDFGIACDLSRSTAKKGRPGTLSYMSPEVYRGGEVTFALDLYAVGMLLYRLLNQFRMPFLPVYPNEFTPEQRDKAMMMRLKGKEPEMPHIEFAEKQWINGQEMTQNQMMKFAKIAQKSIAADPLKRYHNARELREAIENIFK